MQLGGSSWSALCLATLVACAKGTAGVSLDASGPAVSPDAPATPSPDASQPPTPDAPNVVGLDGAVDAGGCAIATGVTPAIDGVDDLADYPTADQIAPGAALGSDGAALTWDQTALYATVTSDAFTDAFEPLHIYLELGTSLDTPVAASGKEYSGLVASLPFTADAPDRGPPHRATAAWAARTTASTSRPRAGTRRP